MIRLSDHCSIIQNLYREIKKTRKMINLKYFMIIIMWCVVWNFVIIVDKHRLVAADDSDDPRATQMRELWHFWKVWYVSSKPGLNGDISSIEWSFPKLPRLKFFLVYMTSDKSINCNRNRVLNKHMSYFNYCLILFIFFFVLFV